MSSRPCLLCAAAVLAAVVVATASAAAAGEPEWIRQFGTYSWDRGRAVATGPDGRVTVVGDTDGHFFGPQKPGRNALVITFDRNGNELWRRQPGSATYGSNTTATDVGHAVATDADGNVYVVGETEGPLGGPYKGSSDAFVIKFNSDGHILWKRQPGTKYGDRASGVATDGDGNVYVVAEFRIGIVIIKFDRDGRTLWKRRPGTKSYDRASAVATDAEGNVYVAGYTGGALGGPYKGGSDAFVLKYDRDGRTVWKRQPGTSAADFAEAVATDADGNVYVVGSTQGALGGAFKGGHRYPYSDAFVIKFDRDGHVLWKRQPGTNRADVGKGVATDANGNVYLVGSTAGALGGPNKGLDDVFVLKLDRDGRYLWKDQPGTTEYESSLDAIDWSDVATDADGNAYVVGWTNGSLPGNANLGKDDAFLIKYGPNGPQ